MPSIRQSKIMILATDGFEQSELQHPLDNLKKAGSEVHVVSLEPGEITGWDEDDWGDKVKVDHTLSDVKGDDYDALVLPGGQINPDLLRAEEKAVSFIRDFARSGKPVAAICHAPWLLIEAGLVKGLRSTSYKSIVTDMKNAGANWVDETTVTDGNIVTARNPGDLDNFVAAIIDLVENGEPKRSAAE